MMPSFFLAISIALTLVMILSLIRTVIGPTVLDRILGGNIIGTKTTTLLLLIGLLYNDLSMFVDIALAYAMLNFIATLAASKFFLRRLGVFMEDSEREEIS
jgi:multicomponent Na+:H+ antiporter subunit F